MPFKEWFSIRYNDEVSSYFKVWSSYSSSVTETDWHWFALGRSVNSSFTSLSRNYEKCVPSYKKNKDQRLKIKLNHCSTGLAIFVCERRWGDAAAHVAHVASISDRRSARFAWSELCDAHGTAATCITSHTSARYFLSMRTALLLHSSNPTFITSALVFHEFTPSINELSNY